MTEEKLLEFLYVAPVALIEFDNQGNVKMANPRVAQLFNRFAPGGYFANFFTFLDDVLPELKQAILEFKEPGGQVMENRRFCLEAPTSNDHESLWLDVTIMRQAEDDYIASLNNVTNQVKSETEKFIAEQRLSTVFDSVDGHVIFTLDPEGSIDSWNVTGETHICSSDSAIDKVLSQVTNLSLEDNAEFLKASSKGEVVKKPIQFKSRYGDTKDAELCMSAIHDQRNHNRGFSVVLTLGH